eukprot:5956380-Pleurochrysis_carterae.AAC.1
MTCSDRANLMGRNLQASNLLCWYTWLISFHSVIQAPFVVLKPRFRLASSLASRPLSSLLLIPLLLLRSFLAFPALALTNARFYCLSAPAPLWALRLLPPTRQQKRDANARVKSPKLPVRETLDAWACVSARARARRRPRASPPPFIHVLVQSRVRAGVQVRVGICACGRGVRVRARARAR